MLKKCFKMILGAFMAFSMVACSSQPEKEAGSILCPSGAPALAMLGAGLVENVTIDYANTDVLQAELSKEDGEYDIIVAPLNLGAKMYENNPVYQLESVLTWGNLYVVGVEGTDLNNASIASFGEKAVPQLIFNYCFDSSNMNITYYSDVSQASQALLTKQADCALLAMPVAAATIAKGKENDINLTILFDLQQEFKIKSGMEQSGYPQASLFVKKESQKKVSYVLDEVKDFIDQSDEDAIGKAIDEAGVETLGVPSKEICVKTWDKQNIRYEKAKDVKEDIENFLNLFHIEIQDDFIIE